MLDYDTRTTEIRKVKRGLRFVFWGLLMVFSTQVFILIELIV